MSFLTLYDLTSSIASSISSGISRPIHGCRACELGPARCRLHFPLPHTPHHAFNCITEGVPRSLPVSSERKFGSSDLYL